MRSVTLGVCVALLSGAALAQVDPAAPVGRLSDAATPVAYRLNLTILPDQPRFSGHVEIDAALKSGTSRVYMHGKALHVTRAVALTAEGASVAATWTQVDPTGVVRLDFARPLSAGKITLAFDYDAPFNDGPSGLYHVKVAGQWYVWNHFESIDARAAFPGFDEPGFKTPYTVSITTRPGLTAVTNTPETGLTPSGPLETHHFQSTKPLPTYLVAINAGPFLHPVASIPPDQQRATSLPLGALATQAQAGKLDFVLGETPPIVALLEDYFGEAFPFPKLDQVATPELPGAMENAGADLYNDVIIVVDRDATTDQKKLFGMVVSHELSHQWFGDLVTPAWWDDLWLNESFANWMGYRIGNLWKPDLHIGVQALAQGFGAMNTDALEVGRPIHQPITRNADIESAFDSITYGKGGQVVSMIAAYLGDEQFKAGVRLHLSRHRYGSATTDQFFDALAEAAHDPRVVTALRSFVDQPGVPLVTFTRQGDEMLAHQSRYAFYKSRAKPEQWTIPLCVRVDVRRTCTLMDGPTARVAAPAGDVFMPNQGGVGYYRFDLPAGDWQALIAELPTLPAGEALATDDSLWASFRAGGTSAASLIAEARAIAGNPDPTASLTAADRFAGFRGRGLIEGAALADYRRLIGRLYGQKLQALGFDPAAGRYSLEPTDTQETRRKLVDLMATEAGDAATNAQLAAAAKRYLAGDSKALDPGFMPAAFTAYVRDGGPPAGKTLMDAALAREDAIFRGAAQLGIASAGRADVADWLFSFKDPRLRSTERLDLISNLAFTAETKDQAGAWFLNHYPELAAGAGGATLSGMTSSLGWQCSADRASQIERVLGPKVRAAGGGVLAFERTVEGIRHCGDLKVAREGELAAALRADAE